jgi:glycine/D-amino acid oxidase-like deaminating enzyme
MPDLRREADLLIIGGGIVGCATAYYAARRGVRVVLVEKGEIAMEQSSRAWGYVRKQGRHPAEVPMAKLASEIWPGLSAELGADVEFIQDGIMAIGENAADRHLLETSAKVAAEHGLTTRLVDGDEIRRLLPGIQGNWPVGLFTPDDGHAEPIKATKAFADAARRHGAEIRTNTPVLDVQTTQGKVSGVVTSSGAIQAKAILCAAGLNGSHFARRFDANIPVEGIRSTVIETESVGTPPSRIAVWGPYVAYRPTQRGTYYLGNGYRGVGGDYDLTLATLRNARYFLPNYFRNAKRIDLKLNSEFLSDLVSRVGSIGRGQKALPRSSEPRLNTKKYQQNLEKFREMYPGLRNVGIKRVWGGRVDLTPDVIPAIGTLPAAKNFYLVTGCSGHGFALGPALGKLMSEWIIDGRPSLNLDTFDPLRFASGRVSPYRESL